MTESELRLGRGLMMTMGLLATAGVIALGWRVAGMGAGLLAGLLFALHPIALFSATRVSVDMTALVFSIAAMLALALLLRIGDRVEAPRGRVVGLGMALGIALALACGSKMNATVVVMTTMAVWAGLLPARGGRWRWPRRAIAAALAVSALVFVAINPTFYADPIGGPLALLRESRINTELQVGFLDGALRTVPERLRELAVLVCRRGWLGPPLVAVVLVESAWAAWRGRSGMIVVCLWWWVATLAVGLWLPFAWPRYAMPLLPPTAVLVAAAIVGAARAVVGRRGRASAG